MILIMMGGLAASEAAVYSIDDGTGESSLGVGGVGTDIAWLNQFTSLAGMESITGVQIAFGSSVHLDPPPNGSPITVGIWSDPTNDGNPADAQLLNSVAGSVTSSHTDTFIEFTFALPTLIPAGDNFFVGFESNTIGTGGSNFAVARDLNSSAGVSWIYVGIGALDLNALPVNANIGQGTFQDLGFAGNALIRAIGGPANSVPEPSSSFVFGLILSMAILRRQR